MIRAYIPKQDAKITYELGIKLFDYSKFFNDENIDDFLHHYNGWVIEENGVIIAFLVFSIEEGQPYLDFIGSSRSGKGYGQLLLKTYLDFVGSRTSFLHVELGPHTYADKLIAWYQRNGFVVSAFQRLGPLQPEMLKYVVTMVRM
jgi:RimJ/RimL family protein N-acetyltransferase